MNLKSIRIERHLSQEQLAELAGLNVRTIQRLESGGRPSVESLKCLAAALDVDITDINLKKTNELIPHTNRTFLYLVFASIFILFGAKSDTSSPQLGAFFYIAAATCFLLVSVKLHKRRP